MARGDFLRYPIPASAFLARGMARLDAFEADRCPDDLLNAALQFRFGIEARLQEYLDATLRSLGKEPDRSNEHVATKLLKKLAGVAPESAQAVMLRITPEQGGNPVHLFFTPVTPELAKMHGELGELLHYNLFHKNPAWFVDADLRGTDSKTLVGFLPRMREIADELARATAGTLLTHPVFRSLLESSEADGAP